jgi:hypothetical protein
MNIKGLNGTMEITETAIILNRKVGFGWSSTTIKIASINSITFTPAGLVRKGSIRFGFVGASDTPLALRGGSADQNALMFTRKQQPDFLRAKEYIQQRIGVNV